MFGRSSYHNKYGKSVESFMKKLMDEKYFRDFHVVEGNDSEDILFVTGNSRAIAITKAMGNKLRLGINQLTEKELSDWKALQASGIISSENTHVLNSSSYFHGANLAININLTSFCNLGCSYCFADGGDYGRIDGKLESDSVDDIFSFIKKNEERSKIVRFEFFGGEPLLNFECIKDICERSGELEKISGIRFIYRISTNLTVLPKGALPLFAKHKFIVSVSIDGNRRTHDTNRPTKGGKGSWSKIVGHCEEVRKVSDDIVLVARMTVAGGDTSISENVKSLWKLNIFDYFQIYPGVVPEEKNEIFIKKKPPGNMVKLVNIDDISQAATKSPDVGKVLTTMPANFLNDLSQFLSIYPDLFVNGNRFKGVLEYELIVDMVINGQCALSYCSGGRNYFTFSPDKSIMPCHRLVGDIAHQVGKSNEGLSGKGLSVWRTTVDSHPVCKECWARYICGGGCRQENLQATGNDNTPSAEGCAYQFELLEGVLRMLLKRNTDFLTTDRNQLKNLFVSCGKPVVDNQRLMLDSPAISTQYFRAIN
jgi:uncharacterized protein